MTTTPLRTSSTLTRPAGTETLVATASTGLDAPKIQPLWRFALVGLGPLTALAVFGILLANLQH